MIIGGEPAVGKSTIVKKVLKKHEDLKPIKYKTLAAHRSKKDKIIYFGIYDGGKFDGTDRLSMSVQPEAIAFLEKKREKYEKYTILLEGDRLFNQKFITQLKERDFCYGIFIITADEEVKMDRHEDREDTQTEKFLVGRKTKVKNIIGKNDVIKIKNNNKKDLKEAVSIIRKFIGYSEEKFIKKFKKEKEDRWW